MQIVIRPSGVYISLNDDALDYGDFEKPQIHRTSHVEPDDSGRWTADELADANMMLAECEPLDMSYQLLMTNY